jgi:ionotropic kainate glutamate receptor 2
MNAPPLAYFQFAWFVQDIETFDLEDFKYNFVNMTAFRIVDAEDVGVREILKDMERFQPVGHSILNKSRIIQVGHYKMLLFVL